MTDYIYNLMGIAGAVIVTYSNIPQMWLFIKQSHAEGISKASTWLGLLGVVLRTLFILHTTTGSIVLLGPYYFAIACILMTLYYCYFPKVEEPSIPKKDAVKQLRSAFYKRKAKIKSKSLSLELRQVFSKKMRNRE